MAVLRNLGLFVLTFCFIAEPAVACSRQLPDTGRFRVGSELGEERAGFSGRAQVLIFTSLDDPSWPAIGACLLDPLLEPAMQFFTGVLVDESEEPDVEAGFRNQGLRVVVRGLNGAVLGLLEQGFTCLELVRLLENTPALPERSPIYSLLLRDPLVIQSVTETSGCETAARFTAYFEEFEGADSPEVTAVKAALVNVCRTFVRGNTTGDDVIDISDPIRTLGYLFLGSPDSLCEDAADANDDGEVNITDPLFLLDHLFNCSGLSPPAPFPEPGADPTADELECL